jgi:hypothetical protein
MLYPVLDWLAWCCRAVVWRTMLITVRGMGTPQDACPILSLWLWPVIDKEAIFCSQYPLAYLGNDSLVCSAHTTCMVPTCQAADWGVMPDVSVYGPNPSALCSVA